MRLGRSAGTVIGSAGDGRQSTATRADYAAGDAAVFTDLSVVNQTFEFAGDMAFTLRRYAAALAELSGEPVQYIDMPEGEYRNLLERAGLPERLAAMLAEASAKSAGDIMFDDGRALSGLIGRPTTPLRVALAETVGCSPIATRSLNSPIQGPFTVEA